MALPVETVRYFVAEIIIALEYLHKNNIIHRDVKPENMLFNKERDEIRVIDCGIAT